MSPRVYDGPVTAPVTQEPTQVPSSGDSAAAPRGRSTAIGAGAFLLLAAPFVVFSLMMLNLKARTELRCDPGGPCTLLQFSWLGRELVGNFKLEELQGAAIERNRSSKKDAAPLYKPVLETTRGSFPLSSRWLEDEAQARNTVKVVNFFRANPLASRKGFILFHDHRRGPLIVGSSFGAVGGVLLGLSLWLAFKARRHLRAEQAARASSAPTP
ncbi:hypothetical protein [Hyalangium sp.]|uniref:hypothetical protein n=1 Tax=Hyalangium sp. TaxID=2028555 RepID=UPI002D41E5AF|nr:hypothetical protein [Hyalangium sp.]HYI01695.1 hypothetical protein [Hyalangium sp.]